MCYPSHSIMGTQSERITRKLWLGTLPADEPIQTWGGPGAGFECDGCDLVISSEEPEHELLMQNGRVMRFHVVCVNLWLILKQALPDRKPTTPPASSL
jgi:hypothetical protein